MRKTELTTKIDTPPRPAETIRKGECSLIPVVFPWVAREVLISLHGRIGPVPLRRADPAIGYGLPGKESTVHA